MNARDIAVQSALAAVNMADPSRALPQRDPLMPPGNHSGLIVELHPDFAIPEGGRAHNQRVFLRTLILETDNPKIPEDGLVTLTMYDLARVPRFASQASDADRFALFVGRLTGAGGEQLSQIIAALITQPQDQILRGMSFAARATFGKAKPGVAYREAAYGAQEFTEVVGDKSSTKSRWVDVDWQPGEEQDDAALAKARAWLDEHHPIRPREVQEQKQVARAANQAAAAPAAGRSASSLLSRFKAGA